MPDRVPAISLLGRHNAGKTTVGEAMVRYWTQQGQRIAVIKHEGGNHAGTAGADGTQAGAADAGCLLPNGAPAPATGEVAWEKPGSDTVRYQQAGAVGTVLAGGQSTLWHVQRDPDVADPMALIARMEKRWQTWDEPIDLVLVEGYKSCHLPKVAVLGGADDVDWLHAAKFAPLWAAVAPSVLHARLQAVLSLGMGRVFAPSEIASLCTYLDERIGR